MSTKPAIRRKSLRYGRGFTYLGLLITILLMTSAMAAVASAWDLAVRRAKEVELLFSGNQFRNALAAYYRDGSSETDRYPQELSDLVKDSRVPVTRRYLRKIYVDPITGSTDWGLVRRASSGGDIGGIIGVYSKSEKTPLKQANFTSVDQGFEERKKYSDWVFVNKATGLAPMPAAGQARNPGSAPFGVSPGGTNTGGTRPAGANPGSMSPGGASPAAGPAPPMQR